MRPMNRTPLFVALLLTLTPTPAFAHDLGVTAKLDVGRLHVEAYFDDDAPARNARVTVADSQQVVVAEGRTNSDGHWSMAAPAGGTYLIVVDAGDGHRTARRLVVPLGDAAARVVTDGPTRGEFTRTRWVGLAIGLLLIAVVVVIVQVRRRVTRR